MKKSLLVITGLALILGFVVTPVMAEFGIGGGIYYNRQLGSIKDDSKWNDNFVSYVLALKYQFVDFLGVEGNLNYYPGTGNDYIDYTFTPMGTVVLSIPLPILDLINAGVGINSTYSSVSSTGKDLGAKDEWSDLAYHYKLGIQIPIASILWICGDCYYFVDNLKNIEDVKSDLLTFGARALFRF